MYIYSTYKDTNKSTIILSYLTWTNYITMILPNAAPIATAKTNTKISLNGKKI